MLEIIIFRGTAKTGDSRKSRIKIYNRVGRERGKKLDRGEIVGRSIVSIDEVSIENFTGEKFSPTFAFPISGFRSELIVFIFHSTSLIINIV